MTFESVYRLHTVCLQVSTVLLQGHAKAWLIAAELIQQPLKLSATFLPPSTPTPLAACACIANAGRQSIEPGG